jgi:hypothetical protein
MSFHQVTVACANQVGSTIIDLGAKVSFHVVNVGPPGADGVNGGGAYTEILHTMPANGATTLPLVAALAGLQVYINGLIQDDYTYTATLLTLPATLNLIAGDKLKITYFSNI